MAVALGEGGRHRTAMDMVFRVLDHDPEHDAALRLALTIAGASRTAILEASEPLTPQYLLDRRLDSLFAVCSACRSSWAPTNCLTTYQKQAIINPVGVQCYACGYVVWRKCLQSSAFDVGMAIVSQVCPNCGGEVLGTPVYPTGRTPAPLRRHARRVEQPFLFREGPLPPDVETITELVKVVSPDAFEDDAEIFGLPVENWRTDMEEFAVGYVLYQNQRNGTDIMAHGVEFSQGRDRDGNRVAWVKLLEPES